MLIILTKSPWTEKQSSILEITEKAAESGEKAAVLHVQDACLATTINEYCERLVKNKIDIFALKADCEARGLVEKVNRNVKLIDYRQWVQLVMTEHEKVVSWTS